MKWLTFLAHFYYSVYTQKIFSLKAALEQGTDAYPEIKWAGFIGERNAILILQHILGLIDLATTEGLPPDARERARVRGADNLTVANAILILRHIAGLETPGTFLFVS